MPLHAMVIKRKIGQCSMSGWIQIWGKCCLYSEILHLFDVLYKMMVTLGCHDRNGSGCFCVYVFIWWNKRGRSHINPSKFWKYHWSMKLLEFRDLWLKEWVGGRLSRVETFLAEGTRNWVTGVMFWLNTHAVLAQGMHSVAVLMLRCHRTSM